MVSPLEFLVLQDASKTQLWNQDFPILITIYRKKD